DEHQVFVSLAPSTHIISTNKKSDNATCNISRACTEVMIFVDACWRVSAASLLARTPSPHPEQGRGVVGKSAAAAPRAPAALQPQSLHQHHAAQRACSRGVRYRHSPILW